MSYASSSNARARLVPREARTLTAESDSSFAEDCRKVQSVVQQIMERTNKIRVEANCINSSDGSLQRVTEARRAACALQADARRLLEAMAVKHGREFSAQQKQMKLSEDLMGASKATEAAAATFAARRRERAARLAAQSQEGNDSELPRLHSDVEAPQHQLQQPGVTQLEMDDHANQMWEYNQVTKKILCETQELHGLMKSMQKDIIQQGDKVDNIEANMSQAAEGAAGAVRELNVAQVAQRKSMKTIFCLLVLAVILAVVIVIVIVRKHAH